MYTDRVSIRINKDFNTSYPFLITRHEPIGASEIQAYEARRTDEQQRNDQVNCDFKLYRVLE